MLKFPDNMKKVVFFAVLISFSSGVNGTESSPCENTLTEIIGNEDKIRV